MTFRPRCREEMSSGDNLESLEKFNKPKRTCMIKAHHMGIFDKSMEWYNHYLPSRGKIYINIYIKNG
jgi:hypothetical protein